jgi:endonuclease I
MKKFLTFIAASSMLWANAAEPDGYYSSCEGKTGQALLTALYEVVGSHTTVSYDGLWNVYKTSDMREDGTLWDMYSTKAWPSNFTKCGNYKVVGDCVNREHSFPKSWFNDKSPMVSDAFHVYPTDGKVNGQRSNYPYGECANGSVLSSNGDVQPLGRLGTSTFSGYTGKVFEPDDQYKGDLARTYFYMATAYNDKISSWSCDMLAGNNYPAYSDWAVNLLLKWTRQDPVSKKETDRNDAVYAFQKNRNPFIDYPELAEYIWGNKVGIAWYPGAEAERIATPVDGTTINVGTTAVGVARSTEIVVKGVSLSNDVTVAISGNGFTATPKTLSATDVNADGATVTITYLSNSVASGTAVLTLTSGDLVTTCNVVAEAVDGMPAPTATNITESSFVFNWSCITADDDIYTIDVRRDGQSITGFPMDVLAGDEQYTVTDLDSETAYTCTVASSTLTSDEVTVTTTAPIPSIEFLYDGDLDFVALPGESSEVAELLMIIENINDNITLSVTAPFQLSTDKSNWSTSIEVSPEEEHFYLRLYGQTNGSYTTSITATATNYFNDDVEATGTISNTATTFYEDFEAAASSAGNYNSKTYVGTACKWQTNALFQSSGNMAYPHSGNQAARMPKDAAGVLTMLESKNGGMGVLTFWSRIWSAETTDADFNVKVSSDGGSTWETLGTITVKADSEGNNTYQEYSYTINRTGALRLELKQTSGGRLMIDDISISDYSGNSSVIEANKAEYHSWDAYCRNHQLVLESDGRSVDYANVYALDGTECFAGTLATGTTTLNLTPGLYIVVVRDFSRRVLVK